jgi:hypothetical protein
VRTEWHKTGNRGDHSHRSCHVVSLLTLIICGTQFPVSLQLTTSHYEQRTAHSISQEKQCHMSTAKEAFSKHLDCKERKSNCVATMLTEQRERTVQFSCSRKRQVCLARVLAGPIQSFNR